MLIMILVITKHLKNYLEIFITKKTTIDEVERKQDEFNGMIGILENYIPRNNKFVEAKNKLLNNAKKFYEETKRITERFKNEVFPFYYDKGYEHQMKFEREEEREEEIKNVRKKMVLLIMENS